MCSTPLPVYLKKTEKLKYLSSWELIINLLKNIPQFPFTIRFKKKKKTHTAQAGIRGFPLPTTTYFPYYTHILPSPYNPPCYTWHYSPYPKPPWLTLRIPSAWMALLIFLLCLRNSYSSFKTHHKCHVLWAAFWNPQIQLMALFTFWQSLMEHPCWFLRYKGERETIIVLCGQKWYLTSYYTLFILLPRSYIVELEEHKNGWLDRRKGYKMGTDK